MAARLRGQLGQSLTLKNVLGRIASRNGKMNFPRWLGAHTDTHWPFASSAKADSPEARFSGFFFGVLGSGVAKGKRFELWRSCSFGLRLGDEGHSPAGA